MSLLLLEELQLSVGLPEKLGDFPVWLRLQEDVSGGLRLPLNLCKLLISRQSD